MQMQFPKDTETEIVIPPPWLARTGGWTLLLLAIAFFYLGATDPADEMPGFYWSIALGIGAGIPLLLFGLWFISMITKISFDRPHGYMTIRTRPLPLITTTKQVSKEEIKLKDVSVRSIQTGLFTYTTHSVVVVLTSGKEIKMLAPNRKWADHSAQRIREFSS